MKISYLFVPVLTITASALSILCLFAGSNKSFFPNADLMTLNMSRIGHTPLFNASQGDGGGLGGLFNSIQGDANTLFSNVGSDVAKALHLPDFFLIYLMGYCKGDYESDTTTPNQKGVSIDCSNHTMWFHFQPTKIIKDQLPSGITLGDLHWPAGIEDIERALEAAGIAMSMLYMAGVVSAMTAVFISSWTLCLNGRLLKYIKSGVLLIAFGTISISSVISTIIITKTVDVVNKYGDSIGIGADKGATFLGMTWAAVAAILLATILSIA